MIWPHRVIDDTCRPEAGPMLIRYFLFRSKYLGIYLHHFLRSDNDRHVHDHPWTFITFLIGGGYWEHIPKNHEAGWCGCGAWHLRRNDDLLPYIARIRRHRFSILYRPATWRHWVEIDKPAWTLVFRFRRERDWGFITEKGWVDHATYDREWCDE